MRSNPGLAIMGIVAIACLLVVARAPASASFVTFESGQVRPLASSPDGSRLFAVNTPDGRLEIFDVDDAGLRYRGSVAVGLEPVAVAARDAGEVWVVNHLSDSVSVIDVASDPPRVVQTLLVGDEPRDIVFAGPGRGRAFITTAHRGQQRTSPALAQVPGAGDPQLTTPGIGRADVWVFDADDQGTALGGTPLRIVTLFGDTPRALAVSPDAGTVYAAVFKSGNQTTVLNEGAVCNGFTSADSCDVQGQTMPGGLPGPSTNSRGEPAPETSLIVKRDPGTGEWRDPLGRDWSAAVRFDLPDEDVFAIDAATLAQTAVFTGVGTTLFNMVVNPASGTVYVSNTEARNEVRFEGPGTFAGSTVQGDLAESRITVLTPAGVFPRHLNKHLDYAQRPAPAGATDHSVATPVDMAISPDGATLYVAAFGSARIAVVDTGGLERNSFDPTRASAGYIALTGGGPSGVVLDAARGRLYVLTRFDDTVSVVDLGTKAETARFPLHNPEPASVVGGRPFLYDARLTSSNGEAACASCHIFGDMDDLAWDLGNPDDPVKTNPLPINLAIAVTTGFFRLPAPINGTGEVTDFHPMKGPMTTQTLRGLDGSGAMHWRGDRATPPGTPVSAFDEVTSFNNFNPAFVGLLGRERELEPADMQRFTDFALQITLPPNPIRALDNSLTPAEERGRSFFLGPRKSDGIDSNFLGVPLGFTCEGCHRLDPARRFFGTDGKASFEAEEQVVKIPHLRNLYQKVGMFGMLDIDIARPLDLPHQGDQIRGFGFLHDGSTDSLFRFLNADVFTDESFGGPDVGFRSDEERRDVEQFMLAFDSNLAPVVGQQITLTDANAAVVGPRIDLLVARAAAGECDLVVKGPVARQQRGWVRRVDGLFHGDRAAGVPVSDAELRAVAGVAGQELTYTCLPAGSGERGGVDRDQDGFLDRDERDVGADPADPTSVPGAAPVLIATRELVLRGEPSKPHLRFQSSTRGAPGEHRIVPPAAGSDGDPTRDGARLALYNASGATADHVTLALPAAGWKALGRRRGWRFVGDGPIRRVTVRANVIVVEGGEGVVGYTLDESSQGRVAMRLDLGAASGWCADAAARTRGNPPSSVRFDRPGRFTAALATVAPERCPPLP